MLMDQELRIAWKAYVAELAAMHSSEAIGAERLREYLWNRLTVMKNPFLLLALIPTLGLAGAKSHNPGNGDGHYRDETDRSLKGGKYPDNHYRDRALGVPY
jgi:hypothetical protein